MGLVETTSTAEHMPAELVGVERASADYLTPDAASGPIDHGILEAGQTVLLITLYYAKVNNPEGVWHIMLQAKPRASKRTRRELQSRATTNPLRSQTVSHCANMTAVRLYAEYGVSAVKAATHGFQILVETAVVIEFGFTPTQTMLCPAAHRHGVGITAIRCFPPLVLRCCSGGPGPTARESAASMLQMRSKATW